VNQSDAHPLITSSVFHYEFEFIHPFIDGNGRMGRLWQTLMLTGWKPLFADMPLESVIKTQQQEYYQALGTSDSAANSTVFISFMLKAILQTLENALVNAPVNIEGLKTPDAILALLETDPRLTRGQMAEQIGKDIRTIARAIKKLQDEGKLQRVGSDKSGHWELL
jgi:Fic family protein